MSERFGVCDSPLCLTIASLGFCASDGHGYNAGDTGTADTTAIADKEVGG